jgi:AcrR family transcriptional regulator
LNDTLRDLRRRQIVATARTIVAEESLEGLTFSALESRLSFTRGVITHHFASKDEIVAAVLESAIAEIDDATREALRESTSWESKLRAMVRANVQGFVERREAARILISFWGRIPRDRAAAKANAALYASYRAQAARLLRAAARDGAIAPVSADAVAALMVAMVIGIATQAYFEAGSIDVAATVREAEETMLARLLPSTRRRPRKR